MDEAPAFPVGVGAEFDRSAVEDAPDVLGSRMMTVVVVNVAGDVEYGVEDAAAAVVVAGGADDETAPDSGDVPSRSTTITTPATGALSPLSL